MATLIRHPKGATGKVHDITPRSAGWTYVGFGLYRLVPGETVAEPTGDTEAILVLVEGRARIGAGEIDFGELGERMDVFEATPPHCGLRPRRRSTGRRPPPPPARWRSAPRRADPGASAGDRPGRHRAADAAARAPTPATSTRSPWRSATSPTACW